MATRQNIQQRPQSLEIKLNSRLFFRLLFVFLCLDVILCCLTVAGFFLWGESRAAGVAALVEQFDQGRVRRLEKGAWAFNGGETVVDR